MRSGSCRVPNSLPFSIAANVRKHLPKHIALKNFAPQ
jgi:hypothetical protein